MGCRAMADKVSWMKKKGIGRLRKDCRGFTFVEVCAVLVVLVILAAVLIPRYTKFIDDAKAETILADARTVLLSAQTAAVEFYAEGEPLVSELDPLGLNPQLLERIMELCDLETEGEILELSYSDKNKVQSLTYTNYTYEARYDGKKWVCSEYEPQTGQAQPDEEG